MMGKSTRTKNYSIRKKRKYLLTEDQGTRTQIKSIRMKEQASLIED
jgi:hypothetical protein